MEIPSSLPQLLGRDPGFSLDATRRLPSCSGLSTGCQILKSHLPLPRVIGPEGHRPLLPSCIDHKKSLTLAGRRFLKKVNLRKQEPLRLVSILMNKQERRVRVTMSAAVVLLRSSTAWTPADWPSLHLVHPYCPLSKHFSKSLGLGK